MKLWTTSRSAAWRSSAICGSWQAGIWRPSSRNGDVLGEGRDQAELWYTRVVLLSLDQLRQHLIKGYPYKRNDILREARTPRVGGHSRFRSRLKNKALVHIVSLASGQTNNAHTELVGTM
ncbi:hypothetical protein DPMN_092319 [Dreissena polymorpha]|uniref:Uncharacterized protein n=1 Tax=Dreissena polymorpha TaxID=45954 RepID=A0A9D4R1K0_DREPO|nr:hypothetical protein DPMN_092319 [Dreissena polymorpha]